MIIVRTPLRVSLCGGGTDLPEYYENNGFGAVCSMAINRYVYVTAKELPDLFPYKYKLAYSETELLTDASLTRHPILRQAIANYNLKSLDFCSMADIPAGTGMGSSSSFTVATLHALSLMQGEFLSKEELASAACRLEIEQLKEPIGKQDQYAAAYGGLNYMEFNHDGSVEVNPLVIDPTREANFTSSMRLFYLGKQSRSASQILRGQKKSGHALDAMKNQAATCSEVFLDGTPEDLGLLLNQAWKDKKRLSDKISTPEIDSVYSNALAQGAWGGKLLGAGGCGFLLVCCKPEIELNLGLEQIDFKIDYRGSTSYYVED